MLYRGDKTDKQRFTQRMMQEVKEISYPFVCSSLIYGF